MKRILAIVLTLVLSFSAMILPASASETYINPETVITNTSADIINIINSIYSMQTGDQDSSDDTNTVTQPITYVDGFHGNILNIFNTIINVQVNTNGLSDSFNDIRQALFDQYGISY